jgi:glycosyltransferase domain-containing protein
MTSIAYQRKLTILLPLKGRPLHTLRFLWHADCNRFPYHFLIVDGEVHPGIAGLLENSAAVFPNLDIEYVRYPDDVSLTRFYRKMASASAKVQTPYVMQADNDDFLVVSGIGRCLEFLEENRDFASYGGGVGGFTLSVPSDAELPHVLGPVCDLTFRCMPQYGPQDYSTFSIAERILNGFSKSHTLYYNVFRSEALATICHELAELDMSDLQLHEFYFGMRAKSLGKTRLDGALMTYMRQSGTGLTHEYRTDWVAHLLRSRFTSDFSAMLEQISRIVAQLESIDKASFAEEVRQLYGDKMRAELRDRYRPSSPARHDPVRLAKKCLRTVLPRAFVHRYRQTRACETIFQKLRVFGASDFYISTFRNELANILETLEAQDFIEFIRRHASDLLGHSVAGLHVEPQGVPA